MTDICDRELLAEFARNESEAAFAELVRRHIALVHSVAWRHTDNPESAQEITQAVFIILARKAVALGRGTVLSGWLQHTARLTAANFRRAEFRRIRREQEAFMQSTIEEAAPDTAWAQLAPMLDEAVAHLGAADRAALVLRHFENKSLAEVGAALGTSEDAAKKRVTRALEKLRKFFTRRGVALSAAAIAGAVSANSVQAAPAGMAAKVSVIAAKGVATTTSITTLVKGTLKVMAWTKAKITVAVAVAGVLLITGAITMILISKYLTPLQPLPALPVPNGYADLVRAGNMVSNDSGNYPTANAAQLRQIAVANIPALVLAKSALSNECRVTVEFTEPWNEKHLPELASIKRLAQALAAEGKLAEKEGRNQDALASYLEVVRLGNQADRGGVIIDELVGMAVESIGLAELQKLSGRLNTKDARAAAVALAELDQQAQTWSEVLRQEDNWSRRTFTGLKNDWIRWLTRVQLRQVFERAEQKLSIVRVKNRQLQLVLAARAYTLDQGHAPAAVGDLVPEYLKSTPQDPHTGKGMVDLPK